MKTKLLSLSLIIFVFWIFWMPGPKVANDFHLTEKSVQLMNILPWTWKETAVADGLGEYYPLSLWSQPMHTFFGLLALINIPFEVQTKLFGLVILILGFWGIWKLLDKFSINTAGKSVGSIFFLLNSFFLLLFDGGQLSLALAYCILPTAVYYFLQAAETDFLQDKLKLAFWVLILSISDIRIVYLLLIVIFIFICLKLVTGLQNPKSFFKRIFLMMAITAVSLIGSHMYWLLPTLISKQIQLPETYGRVSQVSFLSFSSLSHSILFLQPHWYQNIFGKVTAPLAEFIFIPLLAFSAMIFVKKNLHVAFWLLIAVISIFLSKGSNEPFGQVYPWLFKSLPGFSLFRDPSKFYFLTGLSYSILIAFAVQKLSKIKFIPVVLVLYFVFLAKPVILGQTSGLLSYPNFQKEFEQQKNIFQNDTAFSRIFWIPSAAALGYADVYHPSAPAARLSQKRPFAIGTKGTYETFNFLREAPYMGEIFDIAGIGYIAYPYLDKKRDDMHPDNIRYYYTFSNQLAGLPWLKKVDSPVTLFKVQNHQNRFFITPDTWWVIGSDNIYREATESAKLKLSKNALIFAEEKVGQGRRINEVPFSKIVLNGKTNLDLAASFIDPANLIFPAGNLDFEPNSSGWWKREAADLVRWRSFLQDKYGIDNQDFDLGGGWAVGEGKKEFAIYNLQFTKSKVLLARVMESSRSGTLKFYQGDLEIGEIVTKDEGNTNVRWYEVGKLNSNNGLTIATEGDINVVNALAILDGNEWLKYQRTAKEYQDQGRIVGFDEKNTEEQKGSVTYQQLNPTKYIIHINGLTKPSFLVFSQNFNNLWKIAGQSPFPVYSLLNGFRIERDGDYLVEFEPQKYVYPGLIITAATLVILSLCLYRKR